MDRIDAPTASYGSRPQYEREKERLIVEINQGMDIVNRNLLQLNQNLESAISLGSNFSRIASLWSEFGTIINPPIEEDGSAGGNSGLNVDEEEEEESMMDDNGADAGSASNEVDIGPGDVHDYECESLMDEDV
ncbi:Dolichyl-diphosphooligosaccharide-protein glycosyltransferase subunit dad1 [Coemansia furcata]|uniref:Dolichyl-diphosphooligosaccharide-protein glycosyltransferase subunit dad1 n=1 Tax=Coemansia furcata TaxID=417177 RepID=A0ACC1LLK4_9FUNG|nr:Dolichyl-diphosphooligosaccharide-protein glycosyltransferase subunit dad1 [Coemansia furcata]